MPKFHLDISDFRKKIKSKLVVKIFLPTLNNYLNSISQVKKRVFNHEPKVLNCTYNTIYFYFSNHIRFMLQN